MKKNKESGEDETSGLTWSKTWPGRHSSSIFCSRDKDKANLVWIHQETGKCKPQTTHSPPPELGFPLYLKMIYLHQRRQSQQKNPSPSFRVLSGTIALAIVLRQVGRLRVKGGWIKTPFPSATIVPVGHLPLKQKLPSLGMSGSMALYLRWFSQHCLPSLPQTTKVIRYILIQY